MNLIMGPSESKESLPILAALFRHGILVANDPVFALYPMYVKPQGKKAHSKVRPNSK